MQLGNTAETFLAGLKHRYPHNCGFHARYILRLKEHYHTDDINQSLAHACKYYVFDCKAIERILKSKAKPRTLESIRNDQARKILEKTLPEIRQRPLDEYCRLLSGKD